MENHPLLESLVDGHDNAIMTDEPASVQEFETMLIDTLIPSEDATYHVEDMSPMRKSTFQETFDSNLCTVLTTFLKIEDCMHIMRLSK